MFDAALSADDVRLLVAPGIRRHVGKDGCGPLVAVLLSQVVQFVITKYLACDGLWIYHQKQGRLVRHAHDHPSRHGTACSPLEDTPPRRTLDSGYHGIALWTLCNRRWELWESLCLEYLWWKTSASRQGSLPTRTTHDLDEDLFGDGRCRWNGACL